VHLQRGAPNFPKRVLWSGGSSGLTDFHPSTPIGGFPIAPDLVISLDSYPNEFSSDIIFMAYNSYFVNQNNG
jgi:hypothetical protein